MTRLGDLLKGRQRDESVGAAPDRVQQVPVDRIDRNPYQPREVFDLEGLESLQESIRQHGMLQPVEIGRAHV